MSRVFQPGFLAPLLGGILLLSGCGSDPAGRACESDGDCPTSQVCGGGTCEDVVTQACNATTPCPEGYACSAGGECVREEPGADGDADGVVDTEDNCPTIANADQDDADADGTGDACETPDGCTSSGECALAEVCSDGACAGVACGNDGDCPADAVCTGFLCRYAPDCTANSDCTDVLGTCTGGRCVPGCTEAAQCGDNTRCVEGECLILCSNEDSCDPGERCERGVCQPNECEGTGRDGCPEGERCDGEGQCEPFTACNGDGDCDEGETCNDGMCEPAGGCRSDLSCGEGEICEAGVCRDAPGCNDSSECAEGEDCVSGLCVPGVCRGNDDCDPGTFCEGGACVPFVPTEDIDEIIILTRPGAVVPGDTIIFRAVALDSDGFVIVGQSFDFTSSNTAVGTFDGDTFTAGATAGATSVTARPAGRETPVSDPVSVTNLGTPAVDAPTVMVIDRLTASPIGGALVVAGDEQIETGAEGIATFSAPFAGDVSVFAEGYNYVTLTGVTSAAVLVTLGQATGSRDIGGFTADFDFESVSSGGNVSIGLGGAAIGGNLVDLNLQTLLGDSFVTEVSVPGMGSQTVPLPGGIVLTADAFGVGDVKATCYALAENGFTFAWGLGGKVDIFELIPLFTGGGTDMVSIIAAILPLFESFDHDLIPFESEALPRVEDSIDINGDGDTEQLLADYESFPEFTIAPDVAQALRTEVTFPELPVIEDEPAEVAILVGGVVVEGVGFVPTGISAATSTGGGTPDPIVLRMAPSHSGLGVGEYAVLAISFGSNGAGFGSGGIELPTAISGRIFVGARIPETIDFSGEAFPALAEGSTWDAASRSFEGENTGADVYRVTLIGETGSWEVYAAGGAAPEFTVGSAPRGWDDYTEGSFARVEGIVSTVDYDELVGAGGATLRDLNAWVTGFGRFELR